MTHKFVPVVVAWVFIVAMISLVDTEAAKQPKESLGRQEIVHQSSPSHHFTDIQIERGKRYRLTLYWLFFFRTGVTITALIFFLSIGGHETFEGIALWITKGRYWLAVTISSVMLLIQIWILLFPLTFYGGYAHEKAFGLLTQGFNGWFLDYLKGRVVDVAIILPVGIGLFFLIRRFPTVWWIVAGGGCGILLTVFVFLAPVVIDPLFYSFTPIENEQVRDVLLTLADRVGVEISNVLEMDASTKTNRMNAYVTGLGKTKRIVVYDTLIRNSTPEEVGLVFAHELGHWKRYHLWQGIALGTIGSFVAFFVTSLLLRAATTKGVFGLPASASFGGLVFVFLTLTIIDFVSLPLQNWVSRRFEHEADKESLTLTKDPKTFIKVEEQLAVKNLADIDPDPFFVCLLYTHPPVMERIGMAEAYEGTLKRWTKEVQEKGTRRQGDKETRGQEGSGSLQWKLGGRDKETGGQGDKGIRRQGDKEIEKRRNGETATTKPKEQRRGERAGGQEMKGQEGRKAGRQESRKAGKQESRKAGKQESRKAGETKGQERKEKKKKEHGN